MAQDVETLGASDPQDPLEDARLGRDDALAGRVVVVTGGARGLGEAIARRLSRSGAHVVAADVRTDLAEATAASIRDAGGRAEAVELDVTDADRAFAAIRWIADRHSRLDVLVNNAGVDVTAPFEEISIEDWDRILGVNLRGAVVMSQAVFGIMRERGAGHIVNVVSTAAKRAWPNASAYHASKWGLLGFSHALHTEARPFGIKVSAVIAGGMRTPFLIDRFPDLDPAVLQDPAAVAETVRFLLLQPEETVVPEVMVIPMRESSWP
jgi:NAD(P)-dependent dehydrogenase (short-subunit alcohol dehydrogenase family)